MLKQKLSGGCGSSGTTHENNQHACLLDDQICPSIEDVTPPPPPPLAKKARRLSPSSQTGPFGYRLRPVRPGTTSSAAARFEKMAHPTSQVTGACRRKTVGKLPIISPSCIPLFRPHKLDSRELCLVRQADDISLVVVDMDNRVHAKYNNFAANCKCHDE